VIIIEVATLKREKEGQQAKIPLGAWDNMSLWHH